ncbi:MAG: 4Fe-4S dicluster domain-containing protein [Firmicutes bacterium]|nr:4Fe-4S dicluster domain-containing protein [Bacillota bacterium]
MATVMEKELIINKEWCKGCGICVNFCPKDVLELKNGIINVKDESACIKCGLCELRCPDYAIYLGGLEDEEE